MTYFLWWRFQGPSVLVERADLAAIVGADTCALAAPKKASDSSQCYGWQQLWMTWASDVAKEETDVLMYCGVEKSTWETCASQVCSLLLKWGFNTIQKTHTHTHVTYLYCICVLNLLHVPGPFLVWSRTVVRTSSASKCHWCWCWSWLMPVVVVVVVVCNLGVTVWNAHKPCIHSGTLQVLQVTEMGLSAVQMFFEDQLGT